MSDPRTANGEALQSQLMDKLPPSASGSLRDLVAAVGGTRKAADILGVKQRTVQRYIVKEEGVGPKGGKQARAGAAIGSLQRELLADKELGARARKSLAGGKSAGVRMSGDVRVFGQNGPKYRGYRASDEDVDGDALDEAGFFDALDQGDWDAAADALGAAWGEEYLGGGTDWDPQGEQEFELDWPDYDDGDE